MPVSLYGIFLGIHLGDGSIPKDKRRRYRWEVRQRFLENAEKIKIIVEEVFKNLNLKVRIRRWKNQFAVEVYSKQFWFILTQEIGFPEGSKQDFHFDWLKYLPKDVKAGILNGIIGTDGCIFSDSNNMPRIRIRLRNKHLIKTLSQILEEFEIHHTIGKSIEKSRVPNGRMYEREFWRIDIYGKNVLKLREIIGEIWNEMKEKKLREILSVRATGNRCPG